MKLLAEKIAHDLEALADPVGDALAHEVLRFVVSNGPLPLARLAQALDVDVGPVVRRLQHAGLVSVRKGVARALVSEPLPLPRHQLELARRWHRSGVPIGQLGPVFDIPGPDLLVQLCSRA